MHDNLLLLGLKKFTSKKLKMIQKFFLPDKSTEEIKNRYKNLSRYKTASNIIKNWKINNIAPLTKDEEINFLKGKIWFGSKNYT